MYKFTPIFYTTRIRYGILFSFFGRLERGMWAWRGWTSRPRGFVTWQSPSLGQEVEFLRLQKGWASTKTGQAQVAVRIQSGRQAGGAGAFYPPDMRSNPLLYVCVRIWDSTCQDYRFYTPKSCIRTSLREVNPAHKITFQTFFPPLKSIWLHYFLPGATRRVRYYLWLELCLEVSIGSESVYLTLLDFDRVEFYF